MVKITKIYDRCPICDRKWEKENDVACYCVHCKIWWSKEDLWYEYWHVPKKEQATCYKCGKPVKALRVSMVVCYWKDDISGKPVCKECKTQLILKGVEPKKFVNPIDRHKYDELGKPKKHLHGIEKWF